MAFTLSKRKAKNIDMLSGPLLRPMISYTIPIILTGFLQLMFNAADVAVVGRFAGDNALAAVGSNGSLTSLIVNLFIGLSVGANVVAARACGAQDFKKISETVHTSIMLGAIFGLGLSVVGAIFAPIFLKWMGSPEGVIELSTVYLRIYFFGMIPSMVYNFGAAILRSVGDTKRPLVYLTIAGVVNVVLNLIFVVFFHMDVAGVALATVISQCVSAVLVVICLMRSEGAIRFEPQKMRIHKEVFKDIVRIGLPAGVQAMTFSVSNVMIQSTINSFGAVAVAGNSAAANLDCFVNMLQNSCYQACLTFVGQNYGAKQYDRIWKILRTALCCVLVMGTVAGVGVWYFGETLLKIYTTSDEVITAGMIRLLWVSLPYVFCGLNDSVVGALRGMGYSFSSMLMSLIGICGVRLLWVFTFCRMEPWSASVQTVYVSYPVSWVFTLTIQSICFAIAMKKLKMRSQGGL